MPAQAEEIDEAIAEGISIDFLATPVKFTGKNGKLETAECIRMRLGDADDSGRRRPVPIEGSEFTVAADTVVLAIGQKPELPFASDALRLTRGGTIECDPQSLATSMDS